MLDSECEDSWRFDCAHGPIRCALPSILLTKKSLKNNEKVDRKIKHLDVRSTAIVGDVDSCSYCRLYITVPIDTLQ